MPFYEKRLTSQYYSKKYIVIINIDFITGKPNIISVWAENSVGLVTQKATGTIVIDKSPPKTGNVTCPEYIQVYNNCRSTCINLKCCFQMVVFYAKTMF